MKKQKSALFCTLVTYFVMLICFVLVRIVFAYVTFSINSSTLDLLSTLFVQGGLMFVLSVGLFSILRKQKLSSTFKGFGYKKIAMYPMFIAVLIGVVCYFLNTFVASFFSTIINFMGYESAPTLATANSTDYSFVAFLLQVFVVAVLPAIGEETAHRGLLLHGFSSMGVTRALVYSSLLFGLMHLNIHQFFYATILGFIIGLTVVMTNSIFPAIIVHFMNNFLSTYFTFAKPNGWVFSDVPQMFSNFLFGTGNLIGFFLRSIIMLGLILLILGSLFVSLVKHTRVKEIKKMISDIKQIDQEFSTSPQNYGGSEDVAVLHTLKSLIDEYNSEGTVVFSKQEDKVNKPKPFEKVFLWAILTIGIVVTISTFAWGIV